MFTPWRRPRWCPRSVVPVAKVRPSASTTTITITIMIRDATVKVAEGIGGRRQGNHLGVRPAAVGIVYVDGTRLRQTPVQTYELPAGKHVLELVNDPKGKREKMLITLKPGEAQEIKKDWDK